MKFNVCYKGGPPFVVEVLHLDLRSRRAWGVRGVRHGRFDLPADTFTRHFEGGDMGTIRLLHYPGAWPPAASSPLVVAGRSRALAAARAAQRARR